MTKPSSILYKAIFVWLLGLVLPAVDEVYLEMLPEKFDLAILGVFWLVAAIMFLTFLCKQEASVSIGVAPGLAGMVSNPFGAPSPFWVQFTPLGKDVAGIVRAIRTQQTNSRLGALPVVLGKVRALFCGSGESIAIAIL